MIIKWYNFYLTNLHNFKSLGGQSLGNITGCFRTSCFLGIDIVIVSVVSSKYSWKANASILRSCVDFLVASYFDDFISLLVVREMVADFGNGARVMSSISCSQGCLLHMNNQRHLGLMDQMQVEKKNTC